MFIEGCIDEEVSNSMLTYFINNIDWGEGIKTRYGNFTRYQAHINECSEDITDSILELIRQCFNEQGIDLNTIDIVSIYLNYYRDGNDYCPKHRHEGTNQMLLTLGSSRNLYIDNTKFTLSNGSVIFFGNEYHEVKKEKRCGGPRISIVVFYT